MSQAAFDIAPPIVGLCSAAGISRRSRAPTRIARAIEPSMDYRHEIPAAEHNPTIGGAMSNAACDIAQALRAKAILVPTFRGKTASSVARLRPQRPIIALTHIDWARRQMAIEWVPRRF